MVLQIILADILLIARIFPLPWGAWRNTTQLVKYPRVLSVKPSNKVYLLYGWQRERARWRKSCAVINMELSCNGIPQTRPTLSCTILYHHVPCTVQVYMGYWTSLFGQDGGILEPRSISHHLDRTSLANNPYILVQYMVQGTCWYIEDITCPRVDMNFIFECSTRYVTSERSKRVRYGVEREKIKFVSTSYWSQFVHRRFLFSPGKDQMNTFLRSLSFNPLWLLFSFAHSTKYISMGWSSFY